MKKIHQIAYAERSCLFSAYDMVSCTKLLLLSSAALEVAAVHIFFLTNSQSSLSLSLRLPCMYLHVLLDIICKRKEPPPAPPPLLIYHWTIVDSIYPVLLALYQRYRLKMAAENNLGAQAASAVDGKIREFRTLQEELKTHAGDLGTLLAQRNENEMVKQVRMVM